MKSIKSKITFAVLLSALIGTTVVNAGGFQLFEQSAAGLGVAQANAAAAANDTSTEYTNPAGMVRFKRAEVTTGLEMVALKTKFSGSVNTAGGLANPTSGTAKGDTTSIIPLVHFIMPINDKWYYGAGLSVPFGASVDYGDQSVAAQYATTSSIQTINFSQDIAYAIDPRFSVGAGIDLQQFAGKFETKEIDDDTYYDSNGLTSYHLGWHLGGLMQINENNRVGMSYHSQINHHATGNGILGQNGNETFHEVDANFIMPAWLSLGYYHRFNQKWNVMTTLHYTFWNAVKNLTLNGMQILDNGNIRTVIVPQNFRNTMTIMVGTSVQLDQKWLARAGISYDQTPTNNTNRELRLPDQDKINLALGAQYKINDRLDFDFAYEHAFIKKADINTQIPIADFPLEWDLKGESTSSADILGVQVTYHF